MATENDFATFAAGAGANVLSQASYLALQARVTGFQTGIAQSQQLNKVWRQSSIIASMIAQFICDKSGQAAIDDGTIATLEANFISGLQAATGTLFVPPAGLNLYVSATGSDSNSGTTVGSPFLTLQHAANVAQYNYVAQGNPIIVNVANGTYSAGATVTGPLPGNGVLQFVGNVATPTSVGVNLSAAGFCFLASFGARVYVSGFQLAASFGAGANQGNCMGATEGGIITFDHVNFGPAQTAHIEVSTGGAVVTAGGPYTISGNATYHVAVAPTGYVDNSGSQVTLTGTPNFSGAFGFSQFAGHFRSVSAVYSGGATGTRFIVQTAGAINTNAAGANYLPGNAVGVTGTGYYV